MSISLERVSKRFGQQMVLEDLSLEVAKGELFVLLGSSGSGKTTVLRIIAGLAEADSGRVLLDGQDVGALPPQKRGTGFVFQNYSIFRHMSVSENIEFGLRIRKVRRAERAKQRDQLLEMVGLAGFGSRLPSQLSGGQQQRVALARALAYQPRVLLLDEPFGALDVRIRVQLRRVLREIQQRLGVTAVLVTHDREEAFELGDRIGVMERGRLLEVGTPEHLYREPRSAYVATFVGPANILVGRCEKHEARFGEQRVPMPEEVRHDDGAPVQILFRPEDVALGTAPPGPEVLCLGQGEILEQHFSGSLRRVRLRIPRFAGGRQVSPAVPFGEEGFLVDAQFPAKESAPPSPCWIWTRSWRILEPAPPHLLVCDRGDEERGHLELAAWIASRMGASITLLGVAGEGEPGEPRQRALAGRAKGLEGCEVRTAVRFGSAPEQISAESAQELYEMIVLGAGGSDAHPTSRYLVESARVPVLVMRGQRTRLRRVLVGTAAGEPGKSDVVSAGRLARQVGATVTVLYVRTQDRDESMADRHLARATATLRAMEVQVETLKRAGSRPAEGILAAAAEGSHDLIVVGSHGYPGRWQPRIGNVTEEVLRDAPCPVLIVPAGFDPRHLQ